MPEIRRIASTEPEYGITPNAITSTNWDVAAARCLDFVTDKTQYDDAAKWFPLSGTTATDAESDMTNKTLDASVKVCCYLVEVAPGGELETWYSQKTYAEMTAASNVTVVKWAYAYIYQDEGWYNVLGRPCSERFAWQVRAILEDDATIAGIINMFRFEEYPNIRVPATDVPLLVFLSQKDWEHWGEDISDVGHHAIDFQIAINMIQRTKGNQAEMAILEQRVRERINDIVLIENPRFGGYLSEEPVQNPFPESIDKGVGVTDRQEVFRTMIITVSQRDRISDKAVDRVY